MFEKVTVITLLYLTTLGDIKQESFEIFQPCESWFQHNVRVVEPKKRNKIAFDLFTNKYRKRVIKPKKGKGSFKRKK